MAPILHLKITDAGGRVAELLSRPRLAQLWSLDLESGSVVDDDCVALASSPHLSRLRWLGLRHNRVTDAGIEALAASPTLRSLRYVDAFGNPCQEPAPVPSGMDSNGDYTDVDKSALHLRLVDRHGPLPWLTRAWPGVPDPEAV